VSINVVPEHALPKSFFSEEDLSSSGRRGAFESARPRSAELSDRPSPAFESVARSEPRRHIEDAHHA
jgi:hypothetical protein